MTAIATTPVLTSLSAPSAGVGDTAWRSNSAEGTALRILKGGAQDAGSPPPESSDGLATQLMDLYRRTRSRDAFDALVALTRDQLMSRVQSRARFLDPAVDPNELLQDAYINIYRYPDRFDASRPGAFRAWSTTIVDNSVRRYLRKARSGPDVRLKPLEILSQEADEIERGPSQLAIRAEQAMSAGRTFALFLALYMEAYHQLSERERFVLQMVEVGGMRYAELAKVVGIRPDALKMVVFRARKRVAQRVQEWLAPFPGV